MPFFLKGHGLEIVIEGDGTADGFASKQPCPLCGRLYRTRSGMVAHMGTKHEDRGEAAGVQRRNIDAGAGE